MTTKTTLVIEGQKVEGVQVLVEEMREGINYYTLADGTAVRARLVMTGAIRVPGRWQPDGKPVYAFSHQEFIEVVSAPPALCRPATEEGKK